MVCEIKSAELECQIEETMKDTNNIDVIKKADLETLMPLVNEVNKSGWKGAVQKLIHAQPEAFGDNYKNMYRNATPQWWSSQYCPTPDCSLLLRRNEKQTVTVDLWHATRGKGDKFCDFKKNNATFFFPSFGEMHRNYDAVEEYVGEAEDDDEDSFIYYKRGRFTFRPLLWFEDTSVDNLETARKEIIAHAINKHPSFKESAEVFDMGIQNEETWKRALFFRTEKLFGQKFPRELRMDHNCAYECTKEALENGYGGTLAVDLEGLSSIVPPGSCRMTRAIQTESVVVWDVPGCLVNEDEEWTVLEN